MNLTLVFRDRESVRVVYNHRKNDAISRIIYTIIVVYTYPVPTHTHTHRFARRARSLNIYLFINITQIKPLICCAVCVPSA